MALPAQTQHPISPLTLDGDVDAAPCRSVPVGGGANVTPGITAADGAAILLPRGSPMAGAVRGGHGVPLGAARQLPALPFQPCAVRRAAELRQRGLIWG